MGTSDIYWFFGAVFAALFTLSYFFSIGPGHAGAFWPFSTSADAAGSSNPVIHDSSLSLLYAANNLDPDPIKNNGPITLSGGTALVADSGPSGTFVDVGSGGGNGQIALYVVRPGDTLSDISKMFEVSVNTIAWANNLGSARSIHPGQQLIILPVSGVEHVVKKGDTLASLAKKYRADADEIAEYNGISGTDALAIGTMLIVPGGELIAPVATANKPLATKANPYRGGSGAEIDGYYTNPVPGAILTQGIHGWNGVDLGAPRGTPLYASASGVVIIAKRSGWNSGYGNYVVVTHSNGTQSLYAHLSSLVVNVGEAVSQGELIGRVGTSGLVTGPHLHFEVRGARNPFAFCPLGAVCQPR